MRTHPFPAYYSSASLIHFIIKIKFLCKMWLCLISCCSPACTFYSFQPLKTTSNVLNSSFLSCTVNLPILISLWGSCPLPDSRPSYDTRSLLIWPCSYIFQNSWSLYHFEEASLCTPNGLDTWAMVFLWIRLFILNMHHKCFLQET